MSYDNLKTALGSAAYAELREMFDAEFVAATQAKISLGDYIRGLLKSWSVWFGTLLVAVPMMMPDIIPIIQDMFGDDITKRVVQAIGLITIVLRLKTTESIKEKGSS